MISGGCGDIGHATALALQQAGCRVAIGDINLPSSRNDEFHYHEVDVSDEAAVIRWFDVVASHFGGPASIIVVNAAIVTLGDTLSLEAEKWRDIMEINLTGAWLTARTGARRMVAEAMPGRIVFVGSWAAHAPHVHLAAYCTAKAGLRMLAQSMALELADKGILVNEIAPGYVNAGLSAQLFRRDASLAERSRVRVPNKQLVSAQEVAHAIVYMCAPHHRNLTGSTMVLDGGLSLRHGQEIAD